MNDKKKKIYLCTSYISSVSEKEMQHPYLLEWSQCTTAMIQRLWLLIKKTASNTVKPSSSICWFANQMSWNLFVFVYGVILV